MSGTNEIAGLKAEIARCHTRLEIAYLSHFDEDADDMVRVEVPMAERGDVPDGIECRDETIRILEKTVDDLRQERAAMGASLKDRDEGLAKYEAEIERLRDALEEYACDGLGKCLRPRLKDGTCLLDMTGECGNVARTALKGEG